MLYILIYRVSGGSVEQTHTIKADSQEDAERKAEAYLRAHWVKACWTWELATPLTSGTLDTRS